MKNNSLQGRLAVFSDTLVVCWMQKFEQTGATNNSSCNNIIPLENKSTQLPPNITTCPRTQQFWIDGLGPTMTHDKPFLLHTAWNCGQLPSGCLDSRLWREAWFGPNGFDGWKHHVRSLINNVAPQSLPHQRHRQPPVALFREAGPKPINAVIEGLPNYDIDVQVDIGYSWRTPRNPAMAVLRRPPPHGAPRYTVV